MKTHFYDKQDNDSDVPKHNPDRVQIGIYIIRASTRQLKYSAKANTTGNVGCGSDHLLDVLDNEVRVFH
jgi:hypothetical protein